MALQRGHYKVVCYLSCDNSPESIDMQCRSQALVSWYQYGPGIDTLMGSKYLLGYHSNIADTSISLT